MCTRQKSPRRFPHHPLDGGPAAALNDIRHIDEWMSAMPSIPGYCAGQDREVCPSVLTLSITMANCDCKLYSSPKNIYESTVGGQFISIAYSVLCGLKSFPSSAYYRMCVLLGHLSYGAGDMATLICARGGGARILLQGNNTQQLLLLFNFHGNWLFIAEKCNLDIQVEVEQNPYARTLSLYLSAFQDQIASRETHLKFHRKSAERRWLLMRVEAQKQFCLHPIKSKLQLVANCIFNCNNYHPLVIANEVTEWLAEWRRWTMQLQLPRTFREARRVGGGGYIISNHPLSRNRSRGWGSALNCNVMARLNEMEMRGRAGQGNEGCVSAVDLCKGQWNYSGQDGWWCIWWWNRRGDPGQEPESVNLICPKWKLMYRILQITFLPRDWLSSLDSSQRTWWVRMDGAEVAQ